VRKCDSTNAPAPGPGAFFVGNRRYNRHGGGNPEGRRGGNGKTMARETILRAAVATLLGLAPKGPPPHRAGSRESGMGPVVND